MEAVDVRTIEEHMRARAEQREASERLWRDDIMALVRSVVDMQSIQSVAITEMASELSSVHAIVKESSAGSWATLQDMCTTLAQQQKTLATVQTMMVEEARLILTVLQAVRQTRTNTAAPAVTTGSRQQAATEALLSAIAAANNLARHGEATQQYLDSPTARHHGTAPATSSVSFGRNVRQYPSS
eukprot:TRINITY_DN56231_c0_g1_i1.p1 TRINITY_DN56231_c0_g1~~TRINITY_DN56231_c0_g1_i1.p1  ORF type:complete len:185 (-),score=33.76 TRINITY_DN56231_c0_g1_i1:42-596(-)